MLRAYKYRIYPNLEQKEQISQHFGCARWVYNWCLEQKQKYYTEHKKSLSKRKIQDMLVAKKKEEEYQWLNEVNSQSLLASLGN